MANKNITIEISSKEKKLIDIIRNTQFGQLEKVVIVDSEPERIELVTKSVKL